MRALFRHMDTVNNFSEANIENKLEVMFLFSGLSFIFLFAPLMNFIIGLSAGIIMIFIGLSEMCLSQYIPKKIKTNE